MRRRTALTALSAIAAPLLLALPVVTPPAAAAPAARPVAPEVTRLPLVAVRAPGSVSARSTSGPATLQLPARSTTPFSTVGVTWAPDPRLQGVEVSVRTRAAGRWSMWTAFQGGSDDAADPASADASGARAGTEPLWVGPSDGVQVRLTTTAGTPRDVGVELVDPGT
ncbi:MAG: N-acetylmuramoyl-L-alanine amidase, partial [Frankiales bacterium]|nr:N-acetylmuramoyl-L-alanine amidase [Frankiales bacterium]